MEALKNWQVLQINEAYSLTFQKTFSGVKHILKNNYCYQNGLADDVIIIFIITDMIINIILLVIIMTIKIITIINEQIIKTAVAM